MIRRAAIASIVALAALLPAPATAFADPAGPTDYRTTVRSIDPPVEGLEVTIVGGDSFVEVRAPAGTEVSVLGYEGEPYLLIDRTGTVFENQRSPATYYNQERYGADIPDLADATAAPDWRQIGAGGSWAWHDHRAHRMERFPPLNSVRGDEVLDDVVPLVVDGVDVDVHVVSTWMAPPSRIPLVAGLVVGAAVVAVPVAVTRRRRAFGVAAGIPLWIVALAATVVGLVQYRSLPAATDPLLLWWLAPVSALAFSTIAVVAARRRGVVGHLVAAAATAIAGAQLVVWAVERRSGLVRAVLPTDAPFWIDRTVTATAAGAGIVATCLGLAVLFGAPTRAGSIRATAPAPRRSPA